MIGQTILLVGAILAFGTSAKAQAQSSIDHPKIIIDAVELEGTLLPKAVQEQLVMTLKQHEWEEKSDWEGDVRNMAVTAENEGWPDRENQGYLGFSLWEEWKTLRREPGLLHILVTVHVNEGQQRRLEKIEFRDASGHLGPPVFDSDTLRKLIPLNDGEIYNRDKMYAGFSAVRAAYAERGFIDYTSKQTIGSDDDKQTVSVVIEIEEGVRYRWGKIQTMGLDPKIEAILRARLSKDSIANPKLIQDFYTQYRSSLPTGVSPEMVEWKRDPQRGIVDMTFNFSTGPPARTQH